MQGRPNMTKMSKMTQYTLTLTMYTYALCVGQCINSVSAESQFLAYLGYTVGYPLKV